MISKMISTLLNFETSTLSNPKPFLTEFFGGRPTASGQTVTPNTAMQVTAVFACIRVLSDSVASLPLKVFERLSDGGKRPALDHPLYPILKSTPNPEMTSFDMRELIMYHLGLRGNAYHQIIRDGAFRIISLIPLHPDRMTVMRDRVTLELVYRYETQTLGSRTFKPEEIWRINGIGCDGIIGFSPIALHREAIGLAMATEEHGARLFSNGARIPSVLEHPKQISVEARESLEKSFNEKYAGSSNAYKTPILPDGMKLTNIGMNSDEVQFLQTRKFQLDEIARIYRVPPAMIGDLKEAAFKNSPEQQNLAFVVHSLRAWLVRIEQSIERDLMSAQEREKFFVQFDIEGLLRGDSKARAAFYKEAIIDGHLNRNEVRSLENRNPVQGLEKYLIPLNMKEVGEPEPAPKAIRAMALAAATRVINKEIKALSKMILTADALRWERITEFYGKHRAFIMEVLAVDGDFADAHIQCQIQELTKDGAQLMDVINRWRSSKPQILANEVLSQECIQNDNQEENPELVSG